MIEDYEDFKKWNDKFQKDFGGFVATEEWFNNVQKVHSDIRKDIGGLRKTKVIDLTTEQKVASNSLSECVITRIRISIPSIDDLCDTQKLLLPLVDINGKKVRTGKALLTWFNQSDKKGDLLLKKKLEKTISELGEMWATARTEDSSLSVMLTTTAKSFALLGHLGPDDESCFRQGSSNDNHKYTLGQTPNTFILIVKENGKNIARFWGFADEERQVYSIANIYVKNGIHRGNVFAAIECFFADLLKISSDKELSISHDLCSISDDKYIFYNNRSWSYSVTKIHGSQILIPVNKGINEYWQCGNCGEYEEQGQGGEVDGNLVCQYCLDDAGWCDYSEKNTFNTIIPATNIDGKMIYINTELIGDVFIKCLNCSRTSHGSLIHNKICNLCIEEHKKMEEMKYSTT